MAEFIIRQQKDLLDVQKELLDIALRLPEKQYSIEIVPYKKKRSLDANAYLHVLLDKLAKALKLGTDELKVKMVKDYGTIATDEQGLKAGFIALDKVPIDRFYKYAKKIGEAELDGKTFYKYIIYKETHTLDSAEMATLINGVVEECRQLGIETLTPSELQNLK